MIYDFISKITGNTFGYSEVVFALTHLLGFSFAPRIKNLKNSNYMRLKLKKSITN